MRFLIFLTGFIIAAIASAHGSEWWIAGLVLMCWAGLAQVADVGRRNP